MNMTFEQYDRLTELRSFFVTVPDEKLEMRCWRMGFNLDTGEFCMTAGCLLGWAATHLPFVHQGLMFVKGNPTYNGLLSDAAFVAFFGVDYEEAHMLIYPHQYGDEYAETYLIGDGVMVRNENRKRVPKELVLARLDETIARYAPYFEQRFLEAAE